MQLFTVSEISYTAQKIQRSEFIAWLYPAQNVDQARELIAAHNKAHADATHNCYAYVIGFDRETQYYSDAGEPSGTAGKPMLNALLSASMTNVLAIVTRHFGGIKLGVRGLIEAYH
ncbi:MAG: YigZ family protein, partial [Candidatus Cloacimonadaceae bacterium]|nr:YigZ family protein [Candidatus Cloacimonadaceae bacterium]